MIQKSFAKINLALNVLGKKDNGYHELDMVMVPLELHDSLLIKSLKNSKDSSVTFADYALSDSEFNLATIALNHLIEEKHIEQKFRIIINKIIPISAGLGGGSSNAAATLIGINKFLNLNLTNEKLKEISFKIGSDVPFFIDCKPSRIKGQGEKIEHIKILKDYYILIIKPYEGLSSKEIYKCCDTLPVDVFNIDNVVKALETGDDELLANNIGNSLEKAAISLLPKIQVLKDILKKEGFNIVLMSGSGSSVFAMSNEKKKVKKAYNKLIKNYDCYFTKIKKE